MNKSNTNRLKGMSVYLAGPMDRAKDGGVEWRENIIPFFRNLGIIVKNPCDKPITIGDESLEARLARQELLDHHRYDEFARIMKQLRVIDLRMVDESSFMVVNFDIDIPMCGTMEEIDWANRMKRPILLMCPQGKQAVYHWMFGKIPHKHMFGSWSDLKGYVKRVNNGTDKETYGRWIFFDYTKWK